MFYVDQGPKYTSGIQSFGNVLVSILVFQKRQILLP